MTLGTAAQAAPSSSNAPTSGAAISADDQRAAERYWTPERLRGAKDVTALPAARAAHIGTAPTSTSPPRATPTGTTPGP
ncbi:hypothetical protein [Streptomyces sp. NPDC021212]|uniref:hypothetical protein n=1 Tax=Streptomyces sp. NPDC021212 TaxID=3365118 RepID=UPI003792402E